MATVRCAQCGSWLVEITIARGDSTVTMRSCSKCDRRWWQQDGEPVDLPEVLDFVSR